MKDMKTLKLLCIIICVLISGAIKPGQLGAQDLKNNPALDEKVRKFLEDHSGQWRDMNISSYDGQLLYDIIIKGNYKSALEIGTSTGHSGIWIAWALSKTGGRLITVDIDAERHRQALQNFKEAGLSEYIDARLADAHELVKQLKGPFDFVFSDADKDWYKNYFMDVNPKLKIGGCYTTHNISDRSMGGYGRQGGRGGNGGSGDYLEYVRSLKNYETTLNRGTLISYKRAEK
ncbi:MAG: methyltransferase [Bacteroidetes bacterium RBG_19FT_COMBO_42_7]|nr:MAG: methyltransferase [Bacteroidetes bacterium RBG_19FT_COMBO_42_7]